MVFLNGYKFLIREKYTYKPKDDLSFFMSGVQERERPVRVVRDSSSTGEIHPVCGRTVAETKKVAETSWA